MSRDLDRSRDRRRLSTAGTLADTTRDVKPVPQASQRVFRGKQGDRPDSNRYREDHDLGCCHYTTATTKTGTTGIEPAPSRLTSERSIRLSYAPGDYRQRETDRHKGGLREP